MWKRNNFSRHRCEKLTELDSHRQDAIIFFSEENTKVIGVLHFVICNALWLNHSLKLCPYDPPYLLFKTQICKNFKKKSCRIFKLGWYASRQSWQRVSEPLKDISLLVLTCYPVNCEIKKKYLLHKYFCIFYYFEMCQYSVPLCQCAMWKEASKLASLKSWALKGVTVLQK